MEYEGRICTPPVERSSFKLPIMVGCTYNKCKFCGLFKDLEYRVLPFEQVQAEVARVVAVNGKPKNIMLGDGNAFSLPTEYLAEVLDYIRAELPTVETFRADATITSIRQKSDEELALLASKGLTTLYIGIESGLDDVLRYMWKDHLNDECRKQVARIQAQGMGFGAHIMTGVAGAGRGMENAEATARLLNELKPTYVCNFSMIVLGHHTEIARDVKEGRFQLASHKEILEEDRRLVELLEIPVRYDGYHDEVEVHIRGTLPQDKQKMLDAFDAAIETCPEVGKIIPCPCDL